MISPALRRVPALLCALLLLVGTTSCTGGSPNRASKGSTPASRPASASSARSVPLRVEVTHVAGRLGPQQRNRLARQVGGTISAYVDAAFLAGTYPRTDFGSSFSVFTSGAARKARSDRALLTNRPLGSTTESVRAAKRTAYLSVLAPEHKATGVTAAVDLLLVVDRGDKPAARIHLRGQLLLTRDGRGRWSIFGYDLNRSSTPVGKATS